MAAKFQKTSLQVSPTVLNDLGHWPGLTQSEALRLSVERGNYLSTLKAEEIAAVADEYAPMLREALEDLDYNDYRLAARSLPAIVGGFLREADRAWRYEHGDQHQLQPADLLEKLNGMNAMERIGILDCIVAERHRRMERRPEVQETNQRARSPRAADFENEIRERWRLAEADRASYVDINAGEVHRKLGGYPGPENAMPNCCQVMRRLMQATDKLMGGPKKGNGASLLVRYFLPREGRNISTQTAKRGREV